MKAFYFCELCGLKDQEFDAPEKPVAVDIKFYVDTVLKRAALDHALRRPNCQTKHLDLKLPLRDDGRIGPRETEVES